MDSIEFSIRLDTDSPFDGVGVMEYLASHAIKGIEAGDSFHYRRAVLLPKAGILELEVRLGQSPGVTLKAASSDTEGPSRPHASQNVKSQRAALSAKVRQLFDLDADSATIDKHLAMDGALSPHIAANPGIRLPGSLDIQEQLFRTMIGQQVSIASAGTTLSRIARELGKPIGFFPNAIQLAERGLEVLRGPASRVRAIHGVAVALASGSLVLDDTLTVDELRDRLISLPGIGPWTAGYVALRALSAPDVLLSTDLVLLKGAGVLGLPTTPRLLEAYGSRWAPYRSYAGMHLWRIAQQAHRN